MGDIVYFEVQKATLKRACFKIFSHVLFFIFFFKNKINNCVWLLLSKTLTNLWVHSLSNPQNAGKESKASSMSYWHFPTFENSISFGICAGVLQQKPGQIIRLPISLTPQMISDFAVTSFLKSF